MASMSYGLSDSRQGVNENTSLETLSTSSSDEMVRTLNNATSGFIYDPLDETIDSIRLLSFEEGCNRHDVLRCNLIHVTFGQKPVYNALSYTWGQATDKSHTIFINGKPFVVRDNLFKILKSFASHPLRNIDKDLAIRLLWVDAICINQHNPHERSKQVGLMDFIYTRASCVLAWLGSEAPAAETHKIVDLETISEDQGRERRLIFLHPYWKRLWIIQEFVLAARLKVCVGHKIWSSYELQLSSLTTDYELSGFAKQRILDLFEQSLGQHKQSNRLEFLLEKFQYAECQEPRDKIFGFLGLAHDCHDGSLQADYTKPISEIFTDVLRHFCRLGYLQNNSLDIVDRQTRLMQYSQLIANLIGGHDWEVLTGGSSSKDEIQVRGAYCGEILHLGPTYEDMVSSAAANKRWTAKFDIHYTSPTENERLRRADATYKSTLLKIDQAKVARFRAIHSQTCYARVAGWWTFPFSNEDDWTYRERLNKSIANPAKSDAKNPSSRCVSSQPRIFLGSNLLLGLAPAEAQEGDIICRFVNTRSTALFRKEGYLGAYRLVGRVELDSIPLLQDLTARYEHRGSSGLVGSPQGTEFILKLDIETLIQLISYF